MEKLEKFTPDKIQIVGGKVVVSEKTFNAILDNMNHQSVTINLLIDGITAINNHLNANDTDIKVLKDSVVKLANALKIYTEE